MNQVINAILHDSIFEELQDLDLDDKDSIKLVQSSIIDVLNASMIHVASKEMLLKLVSDFKDSTGGNSVPDVTYIDDDTAYYVVDFLNKKLSDSNIDNITRKSLQAIKSFILHNKEPKDKIHKDYLYDLSQLRKKP